MTEMNLANLGCRECVERWLWQNRGGEGTRPAGATLGGGAAGGNQNITRGRQLRHPSGLGPLKNPVPGRESPSGPARSLDHPLTRQGPDIGRDSPPELQVAEERVIEDSGYCCWKKGQVETIDVCYVGTVISPFHKCGN